MSGLFIIKPDETTTLKVRKCYLTEFGKEKVGKCLTKLPPRADLTEITGVSITAQAIYNYVKYDKPISKRGQDACKALVKYFSIEDESAKGVSLETAIKIIKQHGGKVTF